MFYENGKRRITCNVQIPSYQRQNTERRIKEYLDTVRGTFAPRLHAIFTFDCSSTNDEPRPARLKSALTEEMV